jgi:predicted porin
MNTRFTFTPTSMSTAVRGVAAAAALCCAGLASAQVTGPTTVTLYGLVDAGVTRVSGLKAGTVTQVASGIMEGSRWGLKGNEDLGGGYRAIFTLESRVEVDTGANSNRPISGAQLSDRYSNRALLGLPSDAALGLPIGTVQGTVNAIDAALANEFGVNVGANGNRAFDRQAFVGLITPFGAVLAGRQYTPAYETFGTYDIMATQSALSAGQIVAFPAVFEIRTSNALTYRIVQGGISGSLMYAAGEAAGDAGKNRLLGINANYKTDSFSVGLGHNTKNNELGQKSLTSTVLGASMNFASSTISTLVAKITDDNPSNLSVISGLIAPADSPAPTVAFGNLVQSKFIDAFKQDGTLFHIGYRYVSGPSTVSVAYNRYNDSRPADADVASVGVAYSYALSKRTDLNAVLVRYDNKNLAQVAPGGNGYIGGVTATAGTDSTGLALGVRHRF